MLDLPTQDCVTKGTCESVDATIWLVPRCDLLPKQLCSDVAVGTSCFPFCIAARVAGSGNANPVFVDAAGWRMGKQLICNDCTGPSSAVASQNVAGQAGQVSLTLVYGATTLAGVSSGPNLLSNAAGNIACRSGVNTASWISKGSNEGYLPYTRATGQPFAITGDTFLLEDPQADGGVQVMVERLTRDQKDVFTLQRANNDLPAAPKRLVPIGKDITDYLDQNKHINKYHNKHINKYKEKLINTHENKRIDNYKTKYIEKYILQPEASGPFCVPDHTLTFSG